MWIAIAAVSGIMLGCALVVWLEVRGIRIDPWAPKDRRKRGPHES